MRNQLSSRSKRLLDLGQIGVRSLIKEPVREAVREALAEERTRTAEQGTGTRRSVEREDPEGNGNRFLRPAVLLSILGLVALGALVRRRGLMTDLTGTSVADESDETGSTLDSNQRITADRTDIDSSTGYGYHDGSTDGEGSTGYNDHDANAGSDGISRSG